MLPQILTRALTCLILAALLVASGGFLAVFWPNIFSYIVGSSLELTPNGMSYQIWRDTPVPMAIEFYFFNWTNADQIEEEGVKPRFQELGPYRFIEKKEKTDIIWNENDTISFKQQRYWYYDAENSNGSLSDELTTINVVALTAAYVSRDWNYFLVLPLSQVLKKHSVAITHTISEFLFEGFKDPLIDMGKIGSMFAKEIQIPYDKFGWFYTRNGSSDFDGHFNMYTGVGDISKMGVLHEWNHNVNTKYYPGTCSQVKGSAGELFPPDRKKNETISIFSSDICRKMSFDYTGEVSVSNIPGYRYTAGLSNIDNGTLDPSNNCYCGGNCVPSGVVNVSTCRYGAPAFVSYPHFYQADPYYLDQVDGLKPDADKHSFYISLEPTTGIPLDVSARLQLNILMQPYNAITLFRNLPKVFFPMMWFEQRAMITPELSMPLKAMLVLAPMGFIIALVAVTIGITMILVTFFMSWYNKQVLKAKKNQLEKMNNIEAISPLMIRTEPTIRAKETALADSVYFDAHSDRIYDGPYVTFAKRGSLKSEK